MLDEPAQARNNLKRVAKMPFNAAEADDFEKSWLMLSDIHILVRPAPSRFRVRLLFQ